MFKEQRPLSDNMLCVLFPNDAGWFMELEFYS